MTGLASVGMAYSWNPEPDAAAYPRVAIEDDLRDALQSVRAHRPSPQQRRDILDLEAKIGVGLAFLGFPAASSTERDLCGDLVAHISDQRLPITPVLMARALGADLRPILDIQQQTSVRILADIFIPTSAIRLRIEGWTLDDCLDRIRHTCEMAQQHGLDYRIAFEDSTRTSPSDLRRALTVARQSGTTCVVLNDTVGECLPNGAYQHVAFVRDELADDKIALAWHGHNDRGLALANALAAVQAGATVISGTFLGVGERTGNIALEQLIAILDAGTGRFELRHLSAMRDVVAHSLAIEIPPNLPIVGTDAFSTSTGTHAAAIVKARRLGPQFEDVVYSGVSALALGRSQELLIGPNSGRSAIRAVLASLDMPAGDQVVDTVLRYCKSHDRCLATTAEILAAAGTTPAATQESQS